MKLVASRVAVMPRRRGQQLLESPLQVCLVGKASRQGNVGDGLTTTQLSPSELDATVGQIGCGVIPKCFLNARIRLDGDTPAERLISSSLSERG